VARGAGVPERLVRPRRSRCVVPTRGYRQRRPGPGARRSAGASSPPQSQVASVGGGRNTHSSASALRPVRLAYQSLASSTFHSEQTNHQQSANSTFLSEQTSTSHQPPAKRTCSRFPQLVATAGPATCHDSGDELASPPLILGNLLRPESIIGQAFYGLVWLFSIYVEIFFLLPAP
jgi:hypothetical protein